MRPSGPRREIGGSLYSFLKALPRRRNYAAADTNLEAVLDTGAIVAMSFGLVTIWTLMISAMVATWTMRDKD